jgi:hypothetical protein
MRSFLSFLAGTDFASAKQLYYFESFSGFAATFPFILNRLKTFLPINQRLFV